MPWTADNQAAAQVAADAFASQYADALDAWKIALQTGGNAVAAKGRVTDVVERWRTSVNSLEQQSDVIMSDQTAMDQLGQLATQVAEERATLTKLRIEAGTRSDQADSVNPKARTSPYTNILGLRRVFRESTRLTLLIITIIFGSLAFGLLCFLAFSASGPIIATAGVVTGAVRGALAGAGATATGIVSPVGPIAPAGKPFGMRGGGRERND